MKSFFLALLLTFSCSQADGQALEVFELEKFVGRSWKPTLEEKAYCQHFYYSILVDTDKDGKIKNWSYNNVLPIDFKKDFDFLKKFQFPEKYKLRNSTILFFITVNQGIVCPTATQHPNQATEMMTEVLSNIALQLNKNPDTKIIYRPFATIFFNAIE